MNLIESAYEVLYHTFYGVDLTDWISGSEKNAVRHRKGKFSSRMICRLMKTDILFSTSAWSADASLKTLTAPILCPLKPEDEAVNLTSTDFGFLIHEWSCAKRLTYAEGVRSQNRWWCPQGSSVCMFVYLGASLASMATSSPIEVRTITLVSFSSPLNRRSIFSPTSPSGTLTSSLVSPSSFIRDRKPSSVISSLMGS